MTDTMECHLMCRLCLVKEQVNIPIFEEQGNLHTLQKITTCLPLKVTREDRLPKSICDGCNFKLDQQYQFWNTSVNAEKQLKSWLGIVDEPPPKVKKEKEVEEVTVSKRPRRNARRKAAANARKMAAIPSDSDDDNRDFDSGHTVAKEEAASDVEYNENDSLEPTTFVNVSLQDPEQAGPSGVQKSGSSSSAPATATSNTEAGRLYGNYKNIAIKPDPGEFEPLITITEMPPKKSKRSAATPRKLENVIQKLINHSDSDDDDLDFVKQRLASDKTPKRSYSKSGRKKTTPKKIGKRKKSFKKASEEEDNDDEEEEEDDDDNDEDYKPEKKKKSKKSKDDDKEDKVKVKIEPIDYDSDEYVNPFNYGFDTPQAPARKRKAFAKQQTVPTKSVPTKSKWACLICLADLPSKEALITHYADHKDDPIKQETADIPSEHLQNIVPPDVSNSPSFCHICGKVCDSERKLKKHSESHVEEQFYCGYCSITFETAYEFSVHSRSHTIESKFRCDMCDFETLYPNALKAHVQRHETDFRYRCEVCNKGFYSHTWYEEHKNFHTGAKPFICGICDKPFAYTRYLTAHKRSMHPESYKDEPIINECDICQKRFAHKKSLMLHMRGHTGENTVLCDICGKRLSSNEHLKFHRRIHTGYKPYTCDVCSKGFAKKCNLTLHLRVHSGEKPYICDVCGKCFSQRSTLVIHERYHTGARPYTCHLCHKGFVAKGVLSIHLKSCNRNTIMGSLLE